MRLMTVKDNGFYVFSGVENPKTAVLNIRVGDPENKKGELEVRVNDIVRLVFRDASEPGSPIASCLARIIEWDPSDAKCKASYVFDANVLRDHSHSIVREGASQEIYDSDVEDEFSVYSIYGVYGDLRTQGKMRFGTVQPSSR